MMFSLYYIAIASALLALLGQDVAGSKVVIDEEPLEDGSIVSSKICDPHVGQDLRIIRISTISKLHDYFVSLPETNQAACREFYLEPLANLRAIVEVGNENVCGAEMMEQLNQFHWDYVVGSLSKRWRKASNGTLPEPLKMFFVNYAQEVTEKCKDTLLRRLDLAAGNSDVLAESLNTNNFGLIINQMSNILQPQDKIKKHDDFLLIWDQLVDKERKRGHLVEHRIDPVTGETIYISLKVRDPEGAKQVQRKCRQELRPIYGQTVLPVMRLISIGYGKLEKYSRPDVAGSELVRNWYAITQLCQFILPVKFYFDKSLEQEQAIALSMEESSGLQLSDGESSSASDETLTPIEIEPIRLDDDNILANGSNDPNAIIKLIKSNLKVRGRIFRRVIRGVIWMARGQLKSKLKNLFISKEVGENKYAVESCDRQLADGQAEADLLEGDDDDDDDDSKRNGLIRNKRASIDTRFKRLVYTYLAFVVVFIFLFIVATATSG